MARPKKGTSEYFVSKIKQVIEDKKGYDIEVFDMKGCSFTDYFIIASGDTERQLSAIADEAVTILKEQGKRLHHMEGKDNSKWVLLDFGDVVVHLFEKSIRKYFNLERLWHEAKKEA